MSLPLIFISYSHNNELEKDRLVSHLRAAIPPERGRIFTDTNLAGGVDWEANLTKAINEAQIAILLITADYLTSEFITQKEVKSLLQRREKEGLHVFPIIGKACAWRKVDWLKAMNVRPWKGNPAWADAGAHVDEDLAAIAEEIADILDHGSREPIAAATTPAEMPTKAATSDSQPPKVLLLDDKALFRRSVIFNLRGTAQIVEAESVAEAIEEIAGDPDIRVILLDLELKGGEDGTALLEHIKDQASYYRVIVLTGHSEKLAADKAASYQIFRYMEKVNDDSPREALQFEVEAALADLKRETPGKREEFGEEIVKLYPAPFIDLYQFLKSVIHPAEELNSQKAMLELLLNFSGIVLLSEYFDGDRRTDEFDAYLRGRIEKPTLGDWFNIINEIVKRKDSLSGSFFLDSFLRFFTGRNKKSINDLIAVRNKILGHGFIQSEFEVQKVATQCDALLMRLLEDYRIITNYLMCYPLSVEKLRTGYVYTLQECTGRSHRLLKSKRSFSFLMNAQEMHLVKLDSEDFRSLHPFVLLENCAECKERNAFFYSKFVAGQLHYLSYACGHWLVTAKTVREFREQIRAKE
jgi:CheY-like chemotaxis protein